MFYEPKTLIVVYKDEMLANQVKKLIETKEVPSPAPGTIASMLSPGQKRCGLQTKRLATSRQRFFSWVILKVSIPSFP